MTSLKEQLAQHQAGFKDRASPERVALMEKATASLFSSGIEQASLPLGARMPTLSLPDAFGNNISLQSLNAFSSLVIVFYRGGWCPYCNLALREWQRLLPLLHKAGGQLVAISAQTPEHSVSTIEKNQLSFTVLSDSNFEAARAFGLAFEMAPELIALHASVDNDLPTIHGNGQWMLPVPASYLIGKDGLVKYAHVDADYRRRAEPSEIIALLKDLAR